MLKLGPWGGLGWENVRLIGGKMILAWCRAQRQSRTLVIGKLRHVASCRVTSCRSSSHHASTTLLLICQHPPAPVLPSTPQPPFPPVADCRQALWMRVSTNDLLRSPNRRLQPLFPSSLLFPQPSPPAPSPTLSW